MEALIESTTVSAHYCSEYSLSIITTEVCCCLFEFIYPPIPTNVGFREIYISAIQLYKFKSIKPTIKEY